MEIVTDILSMSEGVITYQFATVVFVVTVLFIMFHESVAGNLRKNIIDFLSWVGIVILLLFYIDVPSWASAKDITKLHYHDFYHYYFGSKYYAELSHHELYNCTWKAFDELKASNDHVPEINTITALGDAKHIYDIEQIRIVAEQCKLRFDQSRWTEFKNDIEFYVSLEHSGYFWKEILTDLGNNPPPSWNIVPSFVANIVPLNSLTVRLFPLIDIIIFFVFIPLVIYRNYGILALKWYLTIYLANPLSHWAWNGGSYIRSLWLFLMVWGVAALGKQRYRSAGVLLMLSSTLRVFPVLFFCGALISLAVYFRQNRKPAQEFIMSGAIAGLIMLALSIWLFGWQHWQDFIQYVVPRIDPLVGNAIGFLKIATFYNILTVPAAYTKSILDDWLATASYDYSRYYWFAWLVRLSLLAMVVHICIKLKADAAAILTGAVAVFLLLSAFTYYYVFIALLPIVILSLPFHRNLLFLVLVAGVLALRIVSVYFQHEIGNDTEYYEMAFRSSYILFFMYSVFLIYVSYIQDNSRKIKGDACSKNRLIIGITRKLSMSSGLRYLVFVLLIFSVLSFRLRTIEHDGFKEFQQYVITSSDATANLMVKPATNSWHAENYSTLSMSSSSDWVQVDLEAQTDRIYEIELHLTVGRGYNDIEIEVADRSFSYRETSRPDNPEPRVVRLPGLRFSDNTYIRFRGIGENAPIVLAIDGISLHGEALGVSK